MPPPRDDRVFTWTRGLGAFIVPFLLAAFALWIVPSRTDWFAWTIHPTMTPMIMGAGYISGAYFFTRVVRAKRWHEIHLGFLPITAFTLFMAIATARHLDKFTHDRVAFWIWSVLYVITPILVPGTWLWNRRTDPRALTPDDIEIPRRMRSFLLVAGVVQFVVASILLVSPSTMIDIWPWDLTPLTAGILGGWFALPGVVALMMGIDGRWSAVRVTLQSQLIGLGLILVGVARAWGEFDHSSVVTYLFTFGIAALFAGLAGLWWYMHGLERAHGVSEHATSAPA
jgi:hypothetical protein